MFGRWIVLFACSVSVVYSQDVTLDRREEQAFRQAAVLVAPSVVRIETVGGRDRVGNDLVGTGPTTGLVIARDGYLVTSSFNFIGQPSSILVLLADGRRLAARKVAEDRSRMLTLLKVDADDLPVAEVAPVTEVKVGQWALGLGRTFDGGDVNLSVGIVSALQRIWGKAIQTDAKISPTNYGGPLIDVQGRVMGVLVPLSPSSATEAAGVDWYDSGVGFAIPMTDILAVLPRLKQGEQLVPGLLGITFRARTAEGVDTIIDRVRFKSPAEQGGLTTDDQIVSIDGVDVVRLAQLKQTLGRKYAGDQVRLAVKRGDQRIEANVTLTGELLPYHPPFLGLLPARAQGEDSLVIRYVFPQSPAEKLGLKPQDVIRGIEPLGEKGGDAVEVKSAAQLRDRLSRLQPDERIKLTWARNGESQMGEIQLAQRPTGVPVEIPVPALPTSGERAADAPPVGRISATLKSHRRDYWAYVPEGYSDKTAYALVVWLHPPGDALEATVLKEWKGACDRRGIILIGPQAEASGRWAPTDVEFIVDLVKEFQQKYQIDQQRIVLHTHGSSGPFAFAVSIRQRELFRGLIGYSASFNFEVPENEPESPLMFLLGAADDDPAAENVENSIKALIKGGYPVSRPVRVPASPKYPAGEAVDEFARWVDVLDQI